MVEGPRRISSGIFCLLLALFLAPYLAAQLDTGAVEVTVTDSSGSVIPGASVVLHNERTNTDARSATTNDQGVCSFTLIPSGVYTVRVEHAGFKKYERSGVLLQVNEQISVPAALEVGEITESVTVAAMAPLVETTSGVLRETVDQVRVTELPLNGRNLLQLQSLIPGSVSAGSLDQGASTPGYAVNGAISAANLYSLDGAEYEDSYFNRSAAFSQSRRDAGIHDPDELL